MVKGSQHPGVTPIGIAGRYDRERERLFGMTDEERAYRKQWLKDQELSHHEPKEVPELYKATHNPIRRAYRWPLDQLGKALEPAVGAEKAQIIRYFTGKALLGITALYLGTYYLKYNANDWTRSGGWLMFKSRKAVVEGDPGYPQLSDRTKPEDYANRGFKNVTLNL